MDTIAFAQPGHIIDPDNSERDSHGGHYGQCIIVAGDDDRGWKSVAETKTIAVVDDDQTIRRALDDLIRACGHASALFATAEEFLAYRDRAGIDCIVVDVKMPGMGGIELQSKLNADPPTPPMIFMTSYADDKTRSAAMAGGAFAFLVKPMEIHRLIDLVHMALKQKI